MERRAFLKSLAALPCSAVLPLPAGVENLRRFGKISNFTASGILYGKVLNVALSDAQMKQEYLKMLKLLEKHSTV